MFILGLTVGRLNMFNVELSLKGYWRGQRSQEVGEEGDCAKTYAGYC